AQQGQEWAKVIEVIRPGQEPPSPAKDRERQEAERRRQEQERQKRETEASEQARRVFADYQQAERMEQWKRSRIPREWVLDHLDGWDHPTWVALVNQVKATRFWPLKVDEIMAYLEGLRHELRAERDRQQEAERKRQEEEVRRRNEEQKRQQKQAEWERQEE